MVGKIPTDPDPSIVSDTESLQMVGKIPTVDLENRSSAWEKSINILPAAPLLSCSKSVKEERSEEEALFGLTKGWYQYV